MKLRNPFTDETRRLFTYNYSCFYCGQNGWDAGHHILGRVSNSPLNFSPIHNIKCHIGNGRLDGFDVQSTLLRKTLQYLRSEDYVLTQVDKDFMEKYKQYYE